MIELNTPEEFTLYESKIEKPKGLQRLEDNGWVQQYELMFEVGKRYRIVETCQFTITEFVVTGKGEQVPEFSRHHKKVNCKLIPSTYTKTEWKELVAEMAIARMSR